MNLPVTNQTKLLTSPLSYGNDMFCTWILEMESSNRFIVLRFKDLDLEDTKDCLASYLEIMYMPVNTIAILKLNG